MKEFLRSIVKLAKVIGHGSTASGDNIADLGTRGASPLEIDLGSDWQNGPGWLKLPESKWPVDSSFRENIPDDEIPKVKAMAAKLLLDP